MVVISSFGRELPEKKGSVDKGASHHRTDWPNIYGFGMLRDAEYDLQTPGRYLYLLYCPQLCSYHILEPDHTIWPTRYALAQFVHDVPCHLRSQGHPRQIKLRYEYYYW